MDLLIHESGFLEGRVIIVEVQRNVNIKQQFIKVGKNTEKMNTIARPSMTFWQSVWRKFKRNKGALFCCGVILIIAIMSIIGPHMVKYDPNAIDPLSPNVSFCKDHLFGTDDLGRDLWARTWAGTGVSLIIGFMVAILSRVIGAVVGGLCGYVGGILDTIIMAFINILYAIPQIIVIILIAVVFGKSMWTLIGAMVFYGWLGAARLVRGQVLVLKESEYVTAAKLLGAKSGRIIIKHLIPNTISLLIVSGVMAVPGAIFMEAFLSFIGLGIQPPASSLGQLANKGASDFVYYPYELIVPTILLAVLMLSLNSIGKALNDALDPKQNN